MKTQATTQGIGTVGGARSALLFTLVLAAALAALVTMAGTMREAKAAASNEKIVFASDRTTGTGVNNPTGDQEIFKMNPDGTGLKQLTTNQVKDARPTLSPNGKKIVYVSDGIQTSNPQGDQEVYIMNVLDGSGKKNLSNNGANVRENYPVFSPDGTKIAYESEGIQPSNPEGDDEVYRVNALDGTGKKNLSNNGLGVYDYLPTFSPDGTKIAYTSFGAQTSNPEGDEEIYRMSALDGTGKKNLSNNGGIVDFVPVFSPDGTKIAYVSEGKQTSNPEGDAEIYSMNAADGSRQTNLSNSGAGVNDLDPVFSPGGTKIAYVSKGIQTSNPEGDLEVYGMSALDGSDRRTSPTTALASTNTARPSRPTARRSPTRARASNPPTPRATSMYTSRTPPTGRTRRTSPTTAPVRTTASLTGAGRRCRTKGASTVKHSPRVTDRKID